MLKYLNIQAKNYNICCLPTSDRNHSCVQVYYNNSWHFFDVTYGGYFKKDRKILTFEEIREVAKQGNHLQYLTLFPDTLDRDFSYPPRETVRARTNNQRRMRDVYSRSNLINAKNYGYFECTEEKFNSCPKGSEDQLK